MTKATAREIDRLKGLEPDELARDYQVLADRVKQAESDMTRSKRRFLTDAELDDKMTLIYAGEVIAERFVGVTLGID